MKGKYYGPNKIENVVKLKDKTYFGNERVRLEFKNKEANIELPLAVVEVVASDEEVDLTTLVQAKMRPVVAKILAIVAESELTIDEINYMLPEIEQSVNVNIDKANRILWGKDKGDKTLLDIDKILLPEKYEKLKS